MQLLIFISDDARHRRSDRRDVVQHKGRHLVVDGQSLVEFGSKSPCRLRDVGGRVGVTAEVRHDAVRAAGPDALSHRRRVDHHREAVVEAGVDAVRAVRLHAHARPLALDRNTIQVRYYDIRSVAHGTTTTLEQRSDNSTK